MLDLAISFGANSKNAVIIETNSGVTLSTQDWPQDCDFQIVAFDPDNKDCEVISAEGLAEDIGRALLLLGDATAIRGRKPAWYRRLEICATGAIPNIKALKI